MYVPSGPGLSPRYVFPPNGHAALPFPLDASGGIYFHMARNGIYHLLRALGVDAGDTVLVPDYHHGVEVQAIQAAGASVRTYAVNRHLEPDLDEVARLCRSNPRALFVIHYFGWPQPVEELATLCRDRGIILIEDCALALFSASGRRPLGTFGSYAVFCLYKTLPVPNGGLLVLNGDTRGNVQPTLTSSGPVAGLGHSAGLMLEWLRSRSDLLGRALGSCRRVVAQALNAAGVKGVPAGTAELDLAQVNRGMSAVSHGLLKRFDYEGIRERRRSNFLLLRQRLVGSVAPLRQELGEGVCPLFFPVLVPDTRAAAQALRQRGIGALEWWSHNHACCAGRSTALTDSQFLRDHLLGLPIHQDLAPSHVEYMADQVLALAPLFTM